MTFCHNLRETLDIPILKIIRKSMPKNIVVCLDGTWNGPDEKAKDGNYTPTNVQKVFERLSGSGPLSPTQDEHEIIFRVDQSEFQQVAKYIHGVGDAGNALAKLVEGSVGLGLVARVVRGYTYISRQYQSGDQIFILGFSRGAYAARALAGLIAANGLLDWKAMSLVSGSESSYSAGVEAWYQYKVAIHSGNQSILHSLAETFSDISDRINSALHPAPPLKLVSDVSVYAVGVWDTVGALGVPVVTDKNGNEQRVDEFKFVDNVLSQKVKYGLQAIAIDEQRVDFTPSIWADRNGVVQVLFPGAHADVGGGYESAQSGLSDGALTWMVRQLSSLEVLLTQMPAGSPDATSIGHEPWVDAPYLACLRNFPPGLRLSQQAVQRARATTVPLEKSGPAPYRPANLVNSYFLVDWSGPAPHVQIEP
jgi:uncharacterized protein (DUF2235 family)